MPDGPYRLPSLLRSSLCRHQLLHSPLHRRFRAILRPSPSWTPCSLFQRRSRVCFERESTYHREWLILGCRRLFDQCWIWSHLDSCRCSQGYREWILLYDYSLADISSSSPDPSLLSDPKLPPCKSLDTREFSHLNRPIGSLIVSISLGGLIMFKQTGGK